MVGHKSHFLIEQILELIYNMQIDKASDNISLITLAIVNLVFQINVANGKNWIAIDFDNNKQTNKASNYQYIYIQTISLATLANLVEIVTYVI